MAKTASLKSAILEGKCRVSSNESSTDSEPIQRSHRTGYPSYHNRRSGFAFFIDYITKPKITIFPFSPFKDKRHDKDWQGLDLIFINKRRTISYDTKVSIQIEGPYGPRFERKEPKFLGGMFEQLHHIWHGELSPFHYGVGTVEHPKTSTPNEVNLIKNKPFSTLLLILWRSKDGKLGIYTGSGEEIMIDKKTDFEYLSDNPPYVKTTTNLIINFFVDLEGRTKAGDPVQERKQFRVTVPKFGDLETNLTETIFREVKKEKHSK